MTNYMNLTANQDLFSIPSDGQGGKCTFRTASNAANTTYTQSTVVDANATPWNQGFLGHGAGAFAAIAVDDLVVTNDGFWATVASKTAPGTVTLRTYDQLQGGAWRSVLGEKFDGNVPADAGICAIFSPSILAGCWNNRAVWIDELLVASKSGAADATISLLRPSNAVIVPALVVRASATQFTETPFSLPIGVPYRGPFGVRCSDTTPALSVFFKVA